MQKCLERFDLGEPVQQLDPAPAGRERDDLGESISVFRAVVGPLAVEPQSHLYRPAKL